MDLKETSKPPLTDALEHRERRREERRAALNQMTQDASEAGLYNDTAEDYAAVLKSVRRELAQRDNSS